MSLLYQILEQKNENFETIKNNFDKEISRDEYSTIFLQIKVILEDNHFFQNPESQIISLFLLFVIKKDEIFPMITMSNFYCSFIKILHENKLDVTLKINKDKKKTQFLYQSISTFI